MAVLVPRRPRQESGAIREPLTVNPNLHRSAPEHVLSSSGFVVLRIPSQQFALEMEETALPH